MPWNPLQGLGDIDLPLSTWLFPAFVIPALFLGIDNATSTAYQVLSHSIFALELFLSTLCLSKSLGFKRIESYTSAWLTPILLLPYFGIPILYPLFLFSPQNSTVVAALLLALSLLLLLTRENPHPHKSMVLDLGLSVLIILLSCYACLLAPAAIILIAPTFGFLGIVFIITSKRTLSLNGPGWLIFAIEIILFIYFSVFLYGVFSYTASGMVASKLTTEAMLKGWYYVSNWFYTPAIHGRYLIPFAAFGSLFGIIFGNSRMRVYSVSILSLMSAIFICGVLVVETSYWKLPSLIYYEVFLAPLYSLAAVFGISRATVFIFSFARMGFFGFSTFDTYFTRWMILISLILPVIVLLNVFEVNNPDRVYGPMPPLDAPIIKILKDEIQLKPSKPFRGRVVTMLKISETKGVSWNDLIPPVYQLIKTRGNDHYWSGLWPNQIPTLFKYNPLTSPSFFLTVTSLLGESVDTQVRNVVVLRKPVHNILALLGVKYVITDSILDKPFKLVYLDKIDDKSSIFLYEVPNVNLGSISPLSSIMTNTFQNAIEYLAEPEFDSKRNFILFEELPHEFSDNLANATDASIIMNHGGLHVQAKSKGNSVLILPFEFSRCWKALSNSTEFPTPILFRANATLLGVAFKGELDITLSYSAGLFHNVGCRIQDKNDFKRIQ